MLNYVNNWREEGDTVKDRDKILVVDDDFFGRAIIDVVYQSQYTVLRAENGIAALNILSAEANDIAFIILDLLMPAMDGFEFLEKKAMDTKYVDIPVLVVTAAMDEENKQRVLQLGADAILQKPLDTRVLISTVQQVLESRKHGCTCSEELRQEFIDHVNSCISGGVCSTYMSGQQEIDYISRALATFLGYTSQMDLLSKKSNWRELVVEEDYLFAETEMQYQLSKQGHYVVEYQMYKKNGSVIKMRDFGRYSKLDPNQSMIIRLCVQIP